MSEGPDKDLVVLVPGRDDAAVIDGLLARPAALGIRPISWETQRHPDRDGGCRLRAGEFLRRESRRFRHALVLFDREGSGADQMDRVQIETHVETALRDDGWGTRAAAVVLDPELEIWVWSDSPEVDAALGWAGRSPDLRTWLRQEELLGEDQLKPNRPKEAMESALRHARRRMTSAIFAQLAASVSMRRCTDPAFLKLTNTLRRWFPAQGH